MVRRLIQNSLIISHALAVDFGRLKYDALSTTITFRVRGGSRFVASIANIG